MPRSELIRHREGLIFGSACEAGEVFRALTKGEPWGGDQAAGVVLRLSGDSADRQQQLHDRKGHGEGRGAAARLEPRYFSAWRMNWETVRATGDVHFLEPEDEAFRRILMAGQGFSDADNQAPL